MMTPRTNDSWPVCVKQHGLCGQLWVWKAAEVTEDNAGGVSLTIKKRDKKANFD